jgi:hypothetical protein
MIFNFAITFDIIILTLPGLTQLIYFKKTIVQELGAHKLLIFYSLDYPTNVTPTLITEKYPKFNLLLKKKHLRKHIIGE